MANTGTRDHIHCFWNTRPSNGAFHHVTRPHRWHPSALTDLNRQEIARLGENICAAWAEVAGWEIIARQKRHRGFELDLVIRRGGFLRVVEVKTRIHPKEPIDMNTTTAWLNHKKRMALSRGALFILKGMGPESGRLKSVTCDLVAVDILSQYTLGMYRWPDVFPIREQDKKNHRPRKTWPVIDELI